MASVENTQLTLPGTGPANEGAANSESNKQEGKLIAGKFKSIEEAFEHGFLPMVQGYQDMGQKFNKIVQVLEAVVANNATGNGNIGGGNGSVAIGQAGSNVNPWGRGNANHNYNPNNIDPADFITRPSEYLAARDQALTTQIVGTMTAAMRNAEIVRDFKSKHPDLVPHEQLVTSFVGGIDPSIPFDQRLEKAAQLTKAYIQSIRGNNTNNSLNNVSQEFIEAPAGSQQLMSQFQPANTKSAEEQAFLDSLAAKTKTWAETFGIGVERSNAK